MGKVKGTSQVSYKVVPHRPVKNILFKVFSITIFVGAVVGAYFAGEFLGVTSEQNLLTEGVDLKKKLEVSLKREGELMQRVAVLENASFVDKGSIDDVRRSNRELSDKIARLEEEIVFYQGIMSPTADVSGLTIKEVILNSTPSDNRFRFKVMLTQVGNNSNYLSGSVGISILGVKDGKAVAYPLNELSTDIEDTDIKFRYRYFQDFKGELVLPEGFTPDQIEVVARSTGNKPASVEGTYNWSDLENGNNNVGQ